MWLDGMLKRNAQHKSSSSCWYNFVLINDYHNLAVSLIKTYYCIEQHFTLSMKNVSVTMFFTLDVGPCLTNTCSTGPSVAFVTFACVTPDGVGACCLGVTFITLLNTFIYIWNRHQNFIFNISVD